MKKSNEAEMKLLYTDIRTSLTEILTKEAQGLVAQGKRVFYIAPNSLSFEKERAVLECLSQQASFAISLCLWLCACQFRFNTTRLFHLCKWRSNLCIPLPKNSFSLLSHFASYHDQHYSIFGIMDARIFC